MRRFPLRHTVRAGLAKASLLASFAVLAASPATGEVMAAPAGPSPAEPLSAPSVDSPAASALRPGQAGPAETAGSEEKRHRRPPPPPALATFTGVATEGRARYSYTMVGSNPLLRNARNVVVPVMIIPLRLVFTDGTVLDPTQPDPCMNGLVPLTVVLQSPIFQDFDYGEGPRQFLEQIRRLEFWQLTGPGKLNPGYSVRVSPSVLPTQTVTLSTASFTTAATCLADSQPETMGHFDFSDWLTFFYNHMAPELPGLGVNGSAFVLFLLPNTDFTSHGMPAAYAFHADVPTPEGDVTFAAAQLGVIRPGLLVNIGPVSHEMAEWLDDPYGLNDTPPWGNTGQVTSGCVRGLEVGDPLTGTFLPAIPMPNGVSYQAQETAFFSWFFDQVPSLGFDGWYSSGGTFKTPAAPCH